jgi:glycosyltransferase involved in cell wall biosynthesis
VLIADSHEYIELYRGPRDLRVPLEMVRLREDVSVVSFAPEILSPADSALMGVRTLHEVQLPELPARLELRTLPATTVRFARREHGGKFALMRGYSRALAVARPDAILESVFSWLTPRSYATARVARRLGIPVIYYDPGDDIPVSTLQRLALPLERGVVRSASRIITFSGSGRRRFESKYGYPDSKIRVIPKPIDVPLWRVPVDAAQVRARHGIPADAFVVAFVGRLAHIKGSAVLAQVAALAEADGTKSDWRFLFIGSTLESAEHERDYRRSNTVVTGMLPNEAVPELLAAADVVVFPDVATRGGFWTTIAEAMAAGKAIVFGADTDQEFVPLEDGRTALFVPPGDAGALMSALARMKADPGLRRRLGAEVGRYAAENMDYPRVARAWLEVVDEAIAERR